jgi:UDP-3-O-[3-hydroxymyristoyl] glucosamine N-acyltransferase
MKRRLVVFGTSPFSDWVTQCFDSGGTHEVVARTAHRSFLRPAHDNATIPFVAFEDLVASLDPAEHDIFIALEHSQQNRARAELAAAADALGYGLASFVDPSSRIARDAQLGRHCFVAEEVTVQASARIGDNAILNARCFIGQAASLGDHVYLGNSVFIDRYASIGRHCVLGSQVRVAESVDIFDWSYVKAFEDVVTNLDSPTILHPSLRTPGHIVDRRER